MDSQVLDRSQWERASQQLNSAIVGKRAEIEVASLRLGDQIEAEWTPVYGFAYDPKDDLFHLMLEGVDHMVRHPRAFMIRLGQGGVDSLAIVGAEGEEHIVKFRDPLMLPAPGTTRH